MCLSCKPKDKFDCREPFKINRNLNCDLLVKKGYTWMRGDDVILIGKRTSDTLIYYQIKYPILEIKPSQNDSELVVNSSDKMPSKFCENGIVSWKNFELKLDSTRVFDFKNKIDAVKYKVLPTRYALKESDYIKEAYQVINLIDKDTFNCSIAERNGEWFFSK